MTIWTSIPVLVKIVRVKDDGDSDLDIWRQDGEKWLGRVRGWGSGGISKIELIGADDRLAVECVRERVVKEDMKSHGPIK